ncbi:Maf family protein [Paenibacillus humicola]|uniref:Maf family protein n=1 Tax=Paenibacillus humicola TaxID=3110540 RepID=UPI00237ADA15|nr:Maf family protein [Paenibacillus humicola]
MADSPLNSHSLNVRRLVLASSSPRRRELVEMLDLSLPVLILPTHADETTPPGWTPAQIVEQLALRKARAALPLLQDEPGHAADSVIIGADTIVVLDGEALGKPRDTAAAAAMLGRLQGRTHEVYSGLACIAVRGGSEQDRQIPAPNTRPPGQLTACGEETGEAAEWSGAGYRVVSRTENGMPEAVAGHTVSSVTFKTLSDEEIEGYAMTGEPLDKAGAYGIQGRGAIFVERLEGDFYSVMGLPLHLLYRMLQLYDIRPFQSKNDPNRSAK